jgi:hypothetical protein
MTQEDKELLLKDLCARLPYGVKVRDELGRVNKLVIGNADLIRLYYNDFSIYRENALSLPYLRPMSSMTEEEEIEYDATFATIEIDGHYDSTMTYKSFDFLNAHHFDYRGLIPKGLALEVTEENNPYKK